VVEAGGGCPGERIASQLPRRVLTGGVHADAGLAEGDHGDPAGSAGVVLGQQPGSGGAVGGGQHADGVGAEAAHAIAVGAGPVDSALVLADRLNAIAAGAGAIHAAPAARPPPQATDV